jgi:hypothetical protein
MMRINIEPLLAFIESSVEDFQNLDSDKVISQLLRDLKARGHQVMFEEGCAALFSRIELLSCETVEDITCLGDAVKASPADYFLLGTDTLPLLDL